MAAFKGHVINEVSLAKLFMLTLDQYVNKLWSFPGKVDSLYDIKLLLWTLEFHHIRSMSQHGCYLCQQPC